MMDRASLAEQQWQQEWPSLDTLPMVLSGRLTELSMWMSRHVLQPLLRQYELQPGEFDVLATLRRAGAPYALTATDLYEATMVTSGAMTGRLDRLEAAGWIRRRPHPSDRRALLVELTTAGLDLMNRLMPLHVANLQKAFTGLTHEEQVNLARLLLKLLQSDGGQRD